MTARALIRITATIGAVAALAAAAVPVAGAGPVGDRRSPDTIDAAAVEAHADDALLDRRSPDAIEAAALVRPTAVRDLRSPDTREHSAPRGRADLAQRRRPQRLRLGRRGNRRTHHGRTDRMRWRIRALAVAPSAAPASSGVVAHAPGPDRPIQCQHGEGSGTGVDVPRFRRS